MVKMVHPTQHGSQADQEAKKLMEMMDKVDGSNGYVIHMCEQGAAVE